MRKEHDVWQTTYYHRAIQTSLGSALRASYDLTEPMPDRLSQLLKELEDHLDRPDDDAGDLESPPVAPKRPDRS